ncbi:MAG: hypothetical protein AB7H96_06010 [Vicinamibacterales bacterium]
MTPFRSVVALGLVVLAVAGIIGGPAGLGYACVFVLATVPGWPLGRALFGASHPARWIAGGLLGYGLTTVALWVPLALRQPWWLPFVGAWAVMSAATHLATGRIREPLAPLPGWTGATTRALALSLLLVPLVMLLPYKNVARIDDQGGRNYRAYFTADFVWHEALAAELARFDAPPRNPYMASQPLHYYWGYFVLPSVTTGVVTQARQAPPIESFLAVNNLGAGLLFVGAIFLAAFAAVPRAAAVAAAIWLVVLSASAEGLYQVVAHWQRGIPLSQVKGINIDAVTAWFFYGLTIDGLPRSLWWGPQHANASALGLLAVTVAICAGIRMSVRTAVMTGTALGLALMMSPFPAGSMTLVYGLALLWTAAGSPRQLPRLVGTQFAAVAMVALGLGWCLVNATFEGAGSAVEIGLSRSASRTPFTILGLALGPALVPALGGLAAVAWQRFPERLRPSVVGLVLSGLLFFFVTLVLEPIWVGWRAGHLFLITSPALIALAIGTLHDRLGRASTALVVGLLLVIGLPTTLIDIYNAQDTTNLNMGPGFRWTVRLTPQEQDALAWIQRRTPRSALVQMSLEPRGRETWSLIPSFAHRRMAAGLPISLLRTPEYDAIAERADRIFATEDPAEAVALWRDLKIDYLYVGRVEREEFPAGTAKFDAHPERFGRVFANDEVAIYVLF